MRTIMLAAVVVAALGAGGVARAGPAPHAHDGFYLNLETGFGGLSSSTTQAGIERKFSGGGGVFSVALGGALAPNFVLAGRLWGMSVASPDYSQGGQKLDIGDITFGLGGLGIDLTYYVMPFNLYLTATPSIGSLTVKQGASTNSTKSGFAIRLAVGKEWWVSDNWGLGLDVQYAHSSNDADVANPPTWGTNWLGVAFSATYN